MNAQERAVMQQALEALEKSGCVAFKGLACRCNSTCASYTAAVALRAALAQQPEPAQEPVAWALHTGTRQGIKWNREVEHGTPLYAAPPGLVGVVPITTVSVTTQHRVLTDADLDAIRKIVREGGKE